MNLTKPQHNYTNMWGEILAPWLSSLKRRARISPKVSCQTQQSLNKCLPIDTCVGYGRARFLVTLLINDTMFVVALFFFLKQTTTLQSAEVTVRDSWFEFRESLGDRQRL